MRILVIQGPNLNLLGRREESLYGSLTLEQIHDSLRKTRDHIAGSDSIDLDFFQSNHEGAIIDRIHEAGSSDVDGIIINAASLTHSSPGIRDALLGTRIPFIEIHISNVYAREEFRHKSYLSDVAAGVIIGFGPDGYRLALLGLVERLKH